MFVRTYSGSLDNFLRRLTHKPQKILSPFIREGMTVLDMGCGPGFFTAELARLVEKRAGRLKLISSRRCLTR